DFVQLILDEARLAAHLHHGHIIEIHQVGVQHDQAYIAMEYLPGLDLGRLIKEAGRRTRRVVVALDDQVLAQAVAQALEAPGVRVAVAHGADGLREAAAAGAVDLLILQSRGLAATRDPVLCDVQARHPELLRTVLVGETMGRGFGAYSVVEASSQPEAVAAIARASLRMPLPPELAVQVVRAVVDALDYAHTACDFAGRPLEVVHRDINPSNVLVSINGSVKLVDFGIARATTTLRKEVRGNFVGTYAYMSPEQATGRAADARSDLFSVGALLYEILGGRHPFSGENEFATLRAIREETPPTLDTLQPGLPPRLADMAARCLAKEPGDRYPTARAMLTELEGLIRQDGIDLNPKRLAGFLHVLHGAEGVAAFGVTRTGYAPQPPEADPPAEHFDVGAPGDSAEDEPTDERAEATYDRKLEREPTTLTPSPRPISAEPDPLAPIVLPPKAPWLPWALALAAVAGWALYFLKS
ncbi:MAG: protein kinase, partial [Myxococcales bacterium]|nr:protein kinase [Myxococcales bacterium]